MDKLPPDAKELLERLRFIDDPTPEERRRADAGVRNLLAVRGLRKPLRLPGLTPLPALQLSAATAPALSGGPGSKLLWGTTAVVVLALGVWAGQSWRSPEPAASQVAIPMAMPAPAPVHAESSPLVAAAPTVPAPAYDTRQLHAPTQRARPHNQPRSPRAADDALSEELRFIASVDSEIREGGYNRALQRLTLHRASSPLQEERSAMRVLALCGRDHDSAAARARDQFLKSTPSSLLSSRPT